MQCTPISREKHRIESGYEVSLDCKNLQVGEDMTNLFILKELFYQTIVADFFFFLVKIKTRELFYKTPADALNLVSSSLDQLACMKRLFF